MILAFWIHFLSVVMNRD